ncbi:hypothetical protein GB931_16825 [Modestobacter sp. I12A-02628]|uniref:Uncharacterized protein n=1 Tax=Goekera deserti TaxID=2497753 RepID=A0A7K3WDS9_9ACTN|nr:hypothetical protein [Goekera deserti]MPQ99549.1 hypothetical protein [Goekera deserti]NDI46439.1 hypothetical protein [Goekera deserti]NEL54628.1 hypothetical protein [Goekera deserti]
MLTAAVATVRPVLSAAGFRKRRHTFNRTVEPGLVQVVSYRLPPRDPPGSTEPPVPVPRGLAFMALGIFVEEAWRLDLGRFGPDGPPLDKSWVNDHDCQLRRPTDGVGDTLAQGRRIDNPGTGHAWVRDLGDVFAWFDRFGSRAAIIDALEAAPVDSYEIAGWESDRMLAVRMRWGAGDRRRAQELFGEWVRRCRSEAASAPWLVGHLEYLSWFAGELGLSVDDDTRL